MNTTELKDELKDLESKITDAIRAFIDKTGMVSDVDVNIIYLHMEGISEPKMANINVRAIVEITGK